ncbi:MAG: prolyl oligopeptidase family serine peptidase, partial [Planctomycetaceae bacterium]|nr:prolyl oligopeptidase family serine peptidase [Planctomycetaceae bacterium]
MTHTIDTPAGTSRFHSDRTYRSSSPGRLSSGVLPPVLAFLLFLPAASVPANDSNDVLPELIDAEITSTADGSLQPLRYCAPESAATEPTALFVFLHSWSADYRQNNDKWLREAAARGWIYLHPNFRGINQTPLACGSPAARQDILDAIDFACREFQVDRERIYLAGVSGGGHMAMLMAGHHPERFSAVSAWVGISDLADWYHFHVKDGQPQKYAQMILKSLQGAPGGSAEIDHDYQDRSPLFHLHRARDLPMDIAAGVNDGHTGSVPVSHSLNAYNVLAKIQSGEVVRDYEIQELRQQRKLLQPTASDRRGDPTFSREILLRRETPHSRVTIFEGGHESLPDAACQWLSGIRRTALP